METPRFRGIDVSRHQTGVIIWGEVGDFAILKLTEGSTWQDPSWPTFSKFALAHDDGPRMIGGYHFFRQGTPALTQADNFSRELDLLRARVKISHRDFIAPTLDFETHHNDTMDPKLYAERARELTEIIVSRYGRTLNYTWPWFRSYLERKSGQDCSFLWSQPQWWAQYSRYAEGFDWPEIPEGEPPPNVAIWQFRGGDQSTAKFSTGPFPSSLRDGELRASCYPSGLVDLNVAWDIPLLDSQRTGRLPAPAIKLPSPPAETLRLGSKGEAVAALQRLLQVTPDGIFGGVTKRAVERFQASNQLTVDGIVGPRTRAALSKG